MKRLRQIVLILALLGTPMVLSSCAELLKALETSSDTTTNDTDNNNNDNTRKPSKRGAN